MHYRGLIDLMLDPEFGPVITEADLEWVVCPTCNGRGTSTAYLGSFTADDFAEDPDFAEDYFSGFYDRACDECDGRTTVRELTEAARQRPEVAEEIQSWAETEAIYAMERRMGA